MSISLSALGGVTFGFDGSPIINGSGISIVSGWWYFSSFTSNNTLWSSSGTTGGHALQVNTSSQFTLTVPRSTGYATFTVSFPSALSVNTWYYFATVIQGGSTLGNTPSAKVFYCDELGHPEEVTTSLSNGGSGNFTNGTNLVIGSYGSAGTHMTGNASQICAISTVTDTTITLVNDVILPRFIDPLWSGNFDYSSMIGTLNGAASNPVGGTQADSIRWLPFNCTNAGSTTFMAYHIVKHPTIAPSALTFNSSSSTGVTISQMEPAAFKNYKILTAYHTRPMATR